jgi:branched-chain amino acid aminotransferase
MWIYLNDRFVPEEQAVISVFDHGFLYGDGIYETMRAYQGRVLQLTEHMGRLERSASRIRLLLPSEPSRLAQLVRDSIVRNGLQDAYIRLTVSRGPGEIGLDPALCKSPTLVIMARAFRPYPPSWYRDGVAAVVVQTRRNLPEALPSHVKSLSFLNNVLATIEAKAAGAHEGLMLNYRDELTEGTTSNLFLVQNGLLRTPALDCGLLDGITRRLVLDLARELGILYEETRLVTADLYTAQECFLTNTTQEILPVTMVNGRPVGDGRPGPMTQHLHASFRTRLDRFLDRP